MHTPPLSLDFWCSSLHLQTIEQPNGRGWMVSMLRVAWEGAGRRKSLVRTLHHLAPPRPAHDLDLIHLSSKAQHKAACIQGAGCAAGGNEPHDGKQAGTHRTRRCPQSVPPIALRQPIQFWVGMPHQCGAPRTKHPGCLGCSLTRSPNDCEPSS